MMDTSFPFCFIVIVVLAIINATAINILMYVIYYTAG